MKIIFVALSGNMNFKSSLIILFFFSAYFVKAQDVHFSQYYANPLYINPALT
jgi:hypothetical protein